MGRRTVEKHGSEPDDVANLTHDILSSSDRQPLIVSDEDMEILRELARTPPAPTSELVKALRQAIETEI
jgi:hypothetical protein